MADSQKKSIIFASDFHLGIDVHRTSKERELLIVDWLFSIQDRTKQLYLVGDIFDYWFEYKSSVPKGYSDLFYAFKSLQKSGVEIFFFTGNHDMWMFDYFEAEYGISVYKEPRVITFDGMRCFVGHGDGLGPEDKLYKWIKALFSNRLAQRAFSLVHPSLAIPVMRKISQRDADKYSIESDWNPEQEWLIQFAREQIQLDANMDYFIFGHRHLAYDYRLNDSTRILNLGDWINYQSYAEWDGTQMQLKTYEQGRKAPIICG